MKILIIRLSSMGDIILTQPIIAELQSRFEGCQISYVCKPEYAPLVRLMAPDIEILSYREDLSFFDRLRRKNFDVLLDLHAKLASNLIQYSTKAARRIAYNKRHQLRLDIVAKRTDRRISSTVNLYYTALFRLFKEPISPILSPVIAIPDLAFNLEELSDLNHDQKLIAIFPGAAHHTKIYPEYLWNQFFEIADESWRFILLGSNQENRIAERIMKIQPQRISNHCGEFSFAELAWIMAKSHLTITPDSGPMHLAAAMSLPQIAIFGSTHPRLGFAPLNPNATILCADLPCQPCTLHGRMTCPEGHFNCMKSITPQMLKDAVLNLLRM